MTQQLGHHAVGLVQVAAAEPVERSQSDIGVQGRGVELGPPSFTSPMIMSAPRRSVEQAIRLGSVNQTRFSRRGPTGNRGEHVEVRDGLVPAVARGGRSGTRSQ